MKVFHTVKEFVEWRKNEFSDRSKISIGFVPTMGCLHAGHASLIKQSKEDNDKTFVSVFVNPAQFAPSEDLDQYPRTLPEDIKLLESLGVDALFAPSPSEIYPQGIPLDTTQQRGPFVSVHGISEMLEGKTRPNFFRGVATVVLKLFNITAPDIAYFGQKDIQQFIVLETMVKELFCNLKLKMMPIVRGESGLALSSRNKYLSEKSKADASNIYAGLHSAEKLILKSAVSIKRQVLLDSIMEYWKQFIDSKELKVDYISIADYNTLQELDSIEPSTHRQSHDKVVISCAVYVTDVDKPDTTVRLIDNIIV
ncbi:hypothetical protein TBLA_0I01670 [Henningerozyma blattae CBS 6284]|uniref:Pantoate--beta-alanine ligase n=1 Tax=Henningerozyma blattae (strain ATCC 34711 / CBS 6284 / DSM 70876 / NBRC 10599 / NRRL Y-10934 / UCD 77-7) TaxID=1071380 RepID=I2H8X3_HENB6|nr:hypothetical protein TBLA_0I01670 [Tetrapisispora blattae CBS 6284]CCH62825.1 hypothetical protein TBLA_0I01670 [Tetrapisispora blattae CBS 6284]